MPILVDTGSDRYIKFVDVRGTPQNALIMGYDKANDKYELEASDNFTFDISGVDTAYINTGSIGILDMTWDSDSTVNKKFKFGRNDLDNEIIQMGWASSVPVLQIPHGGRIEITGSTDEWGTNQNRLSIGFDEDDGLLFRSNRDLQ